MSLKEETWKKSIGVDQTKVANQKNEDLVEEVSWGKI